LNDEIDNLDDTAINLAFQLEALNGKVNERTEALKLRMRDLDRERSFVANLLDTAQVVILTQDGAGRIGLANRYTLQITGFDLAELVGRPFKDLLNPVDAHAISAEMTKLIRLQGSLYSHEAELVCATGQRLQLAWFHSALSAPDEGGAVVLSAGLDITERKRAERRIAWLADHDPLTGLVNRRRFEDVLQQALRSGLDRGDTSGALMYVDLDQFKLINDTLGHSAGDRVLEAFSGNLARLGDVIAPGCRTIAARLGGDEFAVVVENTDKEGAVAAAERLRDGLNRLEYSANTEVFRITSSIGVALYPDHGLGFQELMQNADLAMYQAKSLGEGRVQLFSGDEAMRTRMAHRLRWKERIDEALGNDRLVMYFQPILEMETGLISHYEALVRMIDPDGEPVPPADFIPVAEATGQITRVDCRVLDLVFAAWERLRARGSTIGMHINLSARAFQTTEWWAQLNQLLDACDADHSSLVFEITETAAVTDLKDARTLMEAVRRKGCRFALDDFGVGFSSFNYVKELPVDLVKIDGAFITCLSERTDSQVVVKALVDVARGFGKRTVAEFVDSPDTLEMLRTLKVDYAQGFHVGKPVPEDQLVIDHVFSPDSPARELST
jgi:diguanylate cyclase (GGDEF)-like protein/PAS domain S-box-containing protein